MLSSRNRHFADHCSGQTPKYPKPANNMSFFQIMPVYSLVRTLIIPVSPLG